MSHTRRLERATDRYSIKFIRSERKQGPSELRPENVNPSRHQKDLVEKRLGAVCVLRALPGPVPTVQVLGAWQCARLKTNKQKVHILQAPLQKGMAL